MLGKRYTTQLSSNLIKKKKVSYYAEKPKTAKLKDLICIGAYRNPFVRRWNYALRALSMQGLQEYGKQRSMTCCS